MKKLFSIISLFILFSCSSERKVHIYDFTFSNEDFSMYVDKRSTTSNMCLLKLTLFNKKWKDYKSVYIEFTAYDRKINIGSTNFLLSVVGGETIKRESYITKQCYEIDELKLSKFTYR
jgi:hypothetical protein